MKHLSIASTCAVSVLFALAPTTHTDSSSVSPSPSPSVSTATSEATPSASPNVSADVTPSEAAPTTTTTTAPPPPAPLSPVDVIRQHWQELGGENGSLGAATSGLVPLRDGAFIQFYRGGQIYWTAQYAHASSDGIHGAYSAYKWKNGPLGFPTSDEENQTIAGIRGATQTYKNGQIRWNSQGGIQWSIGEFTAE